MRRGYYEDIELRSWDPMRHNIATLININRAKGQAVMKPEKLYPLSFDKKPEAEKPYSKEEMEAVLARRGFHKKDGNWKWNEANKPAGTWQQLQKSQ